MLQIAIKIKTTFSPLSILSG